MAISHKSLWKAFKNMLRAGSHAVVTAWQVLSNILHSMIRARASEAAASIAYYGLFSLFPMLLFVVLIGSFFLQRSIVQQQIIEWASEAIPGSETLIAENIRQVLDWRTTFSLVALASLVWSASGVFTTLAANINRAWPEARTRNYVLNRAMGMSMAVALAAALLLSLIFTTMARLLPSLNLPLLGSTEPYETFLWKLSARTLPFLSSFLALWVMYHWVPNIKVSRLAAFIGALVTTTLGRLLTNMFTWYLSSGLNRYELVYGSLATIVALMFWAYLSSWIALFGAHLTAELTRRINHNHPKHNAVIPAPTHPAKNRRPRI